MSETQTPHGAIAVDLDGTLAEYHGWKGVDHIGPPIPAMQRRVQAWLSQGQRVVIFTARLACLSTERARVIDVIEQWCVQHLGRALEITYLKEQDFIQMWDDRAVQVVPNTGRMVEEERNRYLAVLFWMQGRIENLEMELTAKTDILNRLQRVLAD